MAAGAASAPRATSQPPTSQPVCLHRWGRAGGVAMAELVAAPRLPRLRACPWPIMTYAHAALPVCPPPQPPQCSIANCATTGIGLDGTCQCSECAQGFEQNADWTACEQQVWGRACNVPGPLACALCRAGPCKRRRACDAMGCQSQLTLLAAPAGGKRPWDVCQSSGHRPAGHWPAFHEPVQLEPVCCKRCAAQLQ